MSADRLLGIRYRKDQGPIPYEEIGKSFDEANCQRIIQAWYLRAHGFVLPPEDALSAESFQDTRELVIQDLEGTLSSDDFFAHLAFGDLIHAEKKNKNPKLPLSDFTRQKDLHLAIYAGTINDPLLRYHFPAVIPSFPKDTELIFHGTNNQSKFTTIEDFTAKYRVIQARRIPNLATKYRTIYTNLPEEE